MSGNTEGPTLLAGGGQAPDFGDSSVVLQDSEAPSADQLGWLTEEFIAVTEALSESQASYMLNSLKIGSIPVEVGPGVARVTANDKYWEHDEDGLPHIILAEWFGGQVCDLIAFRGSQPATWLYRTGAADMLGHANLEPNEPALLHPEPLSWMRHNCCGAVVLDWDTAFYTIRSLERIFVPNAAYCRIVEKELAKRRPLMPDVRCVA